MLPASGVSSVTSNRILDSARNALANKPSLSVVVDHVGPVATISTSRSITNGATTTLTFTFNEPVIDFNVSRIVLSGGATGARLDRISGTSPTYFVVVTGAVHNRNFLIGVNRSTTTDLLGNPAQNASRTITIDVTRPTVIISSNIPNNSLTNNGRLIYTFVLSEVSTTFSRNSIDIAGCNATSVLEQTSSTSFLLSCNVTIDGAVTVGIRERAFQDLAGNGNIAFRIYMILADVTPLSVTVCVLSNNQRDSRIARAGNILTISITTSEAVTTPNSVTIGSTKISVSSTDASRRVWIGQYALTGSENEGLVAVTVSGIFDLARNGIVDGMQLSESNRTGFRSVDRCLMSTPCKTTRSETTTKHTTCRLRRLSSLLEASRRNHKHLPVAGEDHEL